MSRWNEEALVAASPPRQLATNQIIVSRACIPNLLVFRSKPDRPMVGNPSPLTSEQSLGTPTYQEYTYCCVPKSTSLYSVPIVGTSPNELRLAHPRHLERTCTTPRHTCHTAGATPPLLVHERKKCSETLTFHKPQVGKSDVTSRGHFYNNKICTWF